MRRVGILGTVAIAGFLAIQLLPYGHATVNPSIRIPVIWDSPRTEALVRRACYDCHSNETHRPWHSRIAPISWFVTNEIAEGRRALNFSEWDRFQREAREAAHELEDGSMPPLGYRLIRPAARLTLEEEQLLIDGLRRSLGGAKGSIDYHELAEDIPAQN